MIVDEPAERCPNLRPGLILVVATLAIYGSLALTVDFPRAAIGIQSDEATYYMMGHSLATDGDLAYKREDLVRVWKEFPSGPNGLFLKKGRDILEWGTMMRPPFVWMRTQPDPDPSRYFYGKSFAYPLAAAPFVRLFGTNGFLVLHAILLTLVVWCSYLFLLTRMNALLASAFTGAFILASIVPVYFVWITPELFNCSLGVLAYFCWLYKEVAVPASAPRRTGWLFTSASDMVAALLLGVATFSKVPNALLFLPILVWLGWQRRWRSLLSTASIFGIVAVGLFAANIAITGEWNYQGGYRRTFSAEFPFQTQESTFEVGTLMGRDESLSAVIFDRRVFWTNLLHNIGYFAVGRYAGLVPYFFPGVFAAAAFLMSPRGRPRWQWLVLGAAALQIGFFIITTPYTWNGGGGSVGNRYFMGAYGILLFLLPPMARTWTAAIPWIIGGVFTAPLVLNPFVTSFHPGNSAKSGPLRWLPVERTLVNDLPINTEDRSKVVVWFGDRQDQRDPGFQIYFLDDNAYGRESDKTFWVKGASRAEFLVKTDRPMRRLVLLLSAGPRETQVDATVDGRTQHVTVNGPQQISFTLPRGFWYQARAFVWVVSISSSTGFVPLFEGPSTDTRFLGVHVNPTLVE